MADSTDKLAVFARNMGNTGGVTVSTAGVVGLGTMGTGIVEVFARSGREVIAVEMTDDLLAKGRERLDQSLARQVKRGRLTAADHEATLARVRFTTQRTDLAEADLVIEAISERLEAKFALFTELDQICAPRTILATNTSSLPVTQIAAATGRADRVVGMHFFNPAPVMRLVEVVHTVLTDPAVVGEVRELAETCGKTPVVVGDRAGFVANALLFGYLNAGAKAAETGQASVQDIDAAIVASCGVPMGPLTLLDLIGLDIAVEVLGTLFTETRDQRYAAAPLLRRLVMGGRLGRKTGSGYYDYAVTPPRSTLPAVAFAAGEPRDTNSVVAVMAGDKSAVCAALSSIAVVPLEDVTDADVIVVDGGSRIGTAELASRVARLAKPGAVLAVATTDQAPVGSLAIGTGRTGDVVGLHVPLAPRPGVVEVVATLQSAPDAVATVVAAVAAAGAVAVPCRDRPGHVVEMIVLPHLGDAARMVDDQYATIEDVDAAMTLGCGYPNGPFAMITAVGPDNLRSGLLHLAAATHLPALAPVPLVDELAAFGAQG
jgi:3-hydroxybutyryl-CoA dehydrogenase